MIRASPDSSTSSGISLGGASAASAARSGKPADSPSARMCRTVVGSPWSRTTVTVCTVSAGVGSKASIAAPESCIR